MTAAERIAEWHPWQRFRPYIVRGNGTRDWVAAAGCETVDGIDPMLDQMREDGEITERDVVTVLDTGPWEQGEPGRWMVAVFGKRYRATRRSA